VPFSELKLKITELGKALNLTVSQVKELRAELNMQRAAIANLTTEVKETVIVNLISIVSVEELSRLQTIFCSVVSEFVLLGSRQRLSTLRESPTLAINHFQVSQVTTAKSLGVTIDDKLDWSGHIEKVAKKVPSGIEGIKRMRHFVPQATLHLK